MKRTVEVFNACRRFFVPEERVQELFRLLDCNSCFSIPSGELSVSFVSVKKMKELHRQFLQDSSLTDVITFIGDPDLDFAGEIVVCPQYARKQSERYENSFSEEIKLYLVHGFLHLTGLKDKLPEEAQQMRSAENHCLDILSDFELGAEIR